MMHQCRAVQTSDSQTGTQRTSAPHHIMKFRIDPCGVRVLPALHHLHYNQFRVQIYRLSSAVQLSTTVIGEVLASSSGVLTRKRWPSGVTA